MKSVSLKAYQRSLQRRAGVRKVRESGRVPAVIYGRHNAPQSLEIGLREIEELMHDSASENLLVDLVVEGDARAKRLALVQDVQHHPLSGQVMHIDLHEVVESEKVTITVPVESLGDAAGVKTGGGVLEHVLFSLKVRALPKDLPEMIQVDVSNLEIGQSLHIGDLTPPPGVEILGDKKIVVISVAAAITEAEEAAATAAPGEAAAAAPTEPEMIKEKKEEGAPAAPAPAAAAGAPAKKKAEKEKPEKK